MKQPKKIPEGNYVRKIRYMARSGLLPRTAGYHEVQVDHDSWCGIFEAKRCNCEPTIALKFSLPAGADN